MSRAEGERGTLDVSRSTPSEPSREGDGEASVGPKDRHDHCNHDPIECSVEALQGEYDETRRKLADLRPAADDLARRFQALWTERDLLRDAITLHHERCKTLGLNDHRGVPQWGGPWDHDLWATVGLPAGPTDSDGALTADQTDPAPVTNGPDSDGGRQ